MFKITAIALTIAASSATATIPSDPLTPNGRATDSYSVQQVRPVYYENAQCRTAQRQIAIYGRALTRLDVSSAQNRQKAALYRQFRQTESDWQEQNCRPFSQTAKDSHRNRTL